MIPGIGIIGTGMVGQMSDAEKKAHRRAERDDPCPPQTHGQQFLQIDEIVGPFRRFLGQESFRQYGILLMHMGQDKSCVALNGEGAISS